MADPRFLRPGDLGFALSHVVGECGEVLEAICKVQQWGLESWNPLLPVADRETNRAWLLREIADLRGALDRLDDELAAHPA